MGTKEDLVDSLSWFHRFNIALAAEIEVLFGRDWKVSVDMGALEIFVHQGDSMVRVPMHPGSHVVTPFWAAHRYADQLHFAAVTRGLLPPPDKAKLDYDIP